MPAPPHRQADGSAAAIASAERRAAAHAAATATVSPEQPATRARATSRSRPPSRAPDPPVGMPEVITTPTGWLLPAGVLYSRDRDRHRRRRAHGQPRRPRRRRRVRRRDASIRSARAGDRRPTIRPIASSRTSRATFRMGVAEDRLFDQAARRSCSASTSRSSAASDGFATTDRRADAGREQAPRRSRRAPRRRRVLGRVARPRTATTVRRSTIARQRAVRADPPFGGIQVRPLDKSEILVDVGWAPEFCYACTDDTADRPAAPSSRGACATRSRLDAARVGCPGCRTSASANLLDAQIFGQVTFTSLALAHAVHDD